MWSQLRGGQTQRPAGLLRLPGMEADPGDVIRGPRPGPPAADDAAADDPARYVTELFRAHHLELVRLAVLIVGDLATAEDVVQDAFEQLHRRWRAPRKQSRALY